VADVEAGDGEALLAPELRALLADPDLWVVPDAGLDGRVVAAVTAELRAAGPAGPAGAGEPAPSPVVVPVRSAARRRWVGPVAGAVAGAAAAAVAVLVVVDGDDGAGETRRTPEAVVALAGTELAPGLVGEAEVVTTPSGVVIRITAPGLPRREGDEFYEGWLRSCDGARLVPIGTFHDLDDAAGWAGASVAQHPLITVTREVVAGPDDVAQASSGEVVLRGALGPCP